MSVSSSLSRCLRLISGDYIPLLGLGTFLLTGGKLSEAVDYALSVGYRHLDTAHSYGNESSIGDLLRTRLDPSNWNPVKRRDLFVTTKLPSVYLGSEDVSRCLERSLENLGLSYVDMYLIHHPWGVMNRGDGTLKPLDSRGERVLQWYDIRQTWRAMENLVTDGKVRNIGLSNFTVRQIDSICSIATIPPSNLQLECHVYLQQSELHRFCNDRNIVMTSYGSLGSPTRPDAIVTDPAPLSDPTVQDMAAKHSKLPPQILLRYLIERNIVVIPKSQTLQRILENAQIFDFSLSKDDTEKLKGLNRNHRFFTFDWAKKHSEYFQNEPF